MTQLDMNPLARGNRTVWIALIALALICLLLVIFAPSNGIKTSGSTYSRAPEGYLGWYTYMQDRGTPVQRWQRPPEELLSEEASGPQTLIQIYSGLINERLALAPGWVDDWLEAGNRLILLGVRRSVTGANFRTQLDSDQGTVRVATRRRQTASEEFTSQQLGDRYGAVVWEKTQESGKLIMASTPHLAANTFQAYPANYAFLAQLIDESDGSVWVNEFLHGYKEADVILEDIGSSWYDYLSETPVAVVVLQLGIITGIFILAQNRRLGTRTVVKNPVVDNSQAYIEALAAVLHKADSVSFVVDAIAKADRAKLQKALGLGQASVDDTALKQTWVQHTGQSSEALMPLLRPPKQLSSDKQLSQWLVRLQDIQKQVNSLR